MLSFRDAIITGGDFRQQITHVHRAEGAFDRLQAHVAHTAFHNSAQRIDAPRCHPNTRVTVKRQGNRWITRSDHTTANASVMWLSGGAGAGKSAIAQSLAEEWYDEGVLLASFFFSRSDPARNHVGSLVPTLVAQIYNLMPQQGRDLILRAIEDDPLVWSKDIFTQFQDLLAFPGTQCGFFQRFDSPRVVVVDGLDECLDQAMQVKVLDLIFKALHEWHLPFLFLVASRPEPDIVSAFESAALALTYFRVDLSRDKAAHADIEQFLRDKLKDCRANHPLRQYIPPDWPSDDAIYSLVDKSSGHFIYPSVTIQYVTSKRHHPHRRLEIILNLRPPKSATDTPFSELDALYSRILSSVEDLDVVRRILRFHILSTGNLFRISAIEAVLQLEEGDVHAALSDMTSLVSISGSPRFQVLRILHASFQEYLLDPSRSGQYYINAAKGHHENILALLSCIHQWSPDNKRFSVDTVWSRLHNCFEHVIVDADFLRFMTSTFSLYRVYLTTARQVDRSGYLYMLAPVSHMLAVLDSSTSPLSDQISQKLRADFDQIICSLLEKLPNNNRLKFNITAASGHGPFHYKKLYSVCLDDDFVGMFAHRPDDHLVSSSDFSFARTPAGSGRHREYFMELRLFFTDGTRSGDYAVSADTLSGAAMFCIEHLKRNDISHRSRILLPKWPPRASRLRMNSPWKSRRKSIRVVYHGSGIKSTISHVLPACSGIPVPQTIKSAIITCRNSEYRMALIYATRLLPVAGRSSELVEACMHSAFSAMSIHFPRLTKRARRAMVNYLVRWECPLY